MAGGSQCAGPPVRPSELQVIDPSSPTAPPGQGWLTVRPHSGAAAHNVQLVTIHLYTTLQYSTKLILQSSLELPTKLVIFTY